MINSILGGVFINALEVKKDIFWTGALDFDLRVFDIIMYSDYGTTYNSYIVKGTEKTVLFEVVKEKFFEEFLTRLKTICDPSEIDSVVISHTEPDHAGALAKLLEIIPNIEVIGSAMAIKFLKNITNCEFNYKIVKDNDSLDIGGKTLNFIMAPLLHWPDTMYTYIPESKTLVTCDSFGCHYCSDLVFNDLIGMNEDMEVAYKYYFDCIMGPFKKNVLNAIHKIENLEIETICNGHGPVIRTDARKYIELYRKWSEPITPLKPKVVLGYLTSYGYTEKIALKIEEGLKSNPEIEVVSYNLLDIPKEKILEEINEAQGLILGSPTLLNDALPVIHEILGHLNPAIHKGMLACAFGSYGWTGEAVDNMEARFKQLKMKMPLESLKVCFNPANQDLEKAFELGQNFGKELITKK